MTCSAPNCSTRIRRDNKIGMCRMHRSKSYDRASYMSAYAKVNKDKLREYKQIHYSVNKHKWLEQSLKRFYNISLEYFNMLNNQQKGLCKICGGPPTSGYLRLSVDHCHKTGKIRGLLCNHCNAMLGYSRDNTIILKAGIQYLTDQKLNDTTENSDDSKADKG